MKASAIISNYGRSNASDVDQCRSLDYLPIAVGGRQWFGSGVARVKALIPVTMKSDAVMPLVMITRMVRCDG